MCDLCNGTHVTYKFTNYSVLAISCPVCGPISQEEHRARMDSVKECIKRFKEEMAHVK